MSRSGCMAETCSYFDSDAWDTRLDQYVRRSWELEHVLRESATHTYPDDLADITSEIDDLSPDEAAQKPVGEIIECIDADQHDLSIGAVRETWKQQADLPDSCPYEVHDASDNFCLCHMPPEERRAAGIKNDDIVSWIQDQLQNSVSDMSVYSFVGARFGQLNLSSERLTVDNNRPLDFRFMTVQDGITCVDTVFDQAVRFKGARFGTQDDQHSVIDSNPSANHFIDFNAPIEFTRATFNDTADFKFALFATDVSFNNATFAAGMFNYADFAGRADFMATTFNGKADYSKARFQCAAMLNGTYRSAAIYNYTAFHDTVSIWTTTFNRKAEFWATTFHGDVNGTYAEFNGRTSFADVTFDGSVEFDNASFHDTVHFRDVQSTEPISLADAVLERGTISLPASNPPFYDFTRATIGDITFDADETIAENLFEYFNITETVFDDFDFAKYSAYLRPDWKLHTNTVPDAPFDTNPCPDELEATYLKAKQGAKAVGHNKAASEFFFHEMRFRKQQHKSRIRQSWPDLVTDWDTFKNSVVSTVRWISNATLGYIAGYGERPRNVIYSSLFVVFAFAVLYPFLDTEDAYAGVIGEEYLLLSFQSFITFILGQTPEQATFWFEFATAVQGFIGAFLIALLVFTLTRSIHR